MEGLAFEALDEDGLGDPELGGVVREGLAVDVGELREKMIEERTRLVTNPPKTSRKKPKRSRASSSEIASSLKTLACMAESWIRRLPPPTS